MAKLHTWTHWEHTLLRTCHRHCPAYKLHSLTHYTSNIFHLYTLLPFLMSCMPRISCYWCMIHNSESQLNRLCINYLLSQNRQYSLKTYKEESRWSSNYLRIMIGNVSKACYCWFETRKLKYLQQLNCMSDMLSNTRRRNMMSLHNYKPLKPVFWIKKRYRLYRLTQSRILDPKTLKNNSNRCTYTRSTDGTN